MQAFEVDNNGKHEVWEITKTNTEKGIVYRAQIKDQSGSPFVSSPASQEITVEGKGGPFNSIVIHEDGSMSCGGCKVREIKPA